MMSPYSSADQLERSVSLRPHNSDESQSSGRRHNESGKSAMCDVRSLSARSVVLLLFAVLYFSLAYWFDYGIVATDLHNAPFQVSAFYLHFQCFNGSLFQLCSWFRSILRSHDLH
jgi:hypothetical protein